MIRTYKYRIWPTKHQQMVLDGLEDKAIHFYNYFIENKYLTDELLLENPEHEILIYEMYSRYQTARKNYIQNRRQANNATFSAPKLKTRETREGIAIEINPEIQSNRVVFNDLNIKIKIHRALPEYQKVWLKRDFDEYYLLFDCCVPDVDYNNKIVGIDMGEVNICTIHDGLESIIYPAKKFYKNPKKQARSQKAYTQLIASTLKGCIVKVEELQYFLNSGKQRRSSWDLLRKCIQNVCFKMLKKNPANTSVTCFECKSVDKNNRLTQSEFKCLNCGHEDNADVNAAKNIREL